MTAKETWHAVFDHLAARREQRRAGRNQPAKLQQVVLVAAGAVQQQEGRGFEPGARLEAMNEVQMLVHQAALSSDGSTPSICLRCGSRNGGSFRSWPSVATGSSTAKPGMSVAISNRMPPGSRK